MSSSDFAVQALYSNHHGWLNTWLRCRLGNAADAADLAQDTFVRLLQRTERLELKAPRAFLRTIARGLVIDHWRRDFDGSAGPEQSAPPGGQTRHPLAAATAQ